MFIKLQSNQIPIFWDAIRHGMIESYGVPKELQQDFAIKSLEQLLSGMSQCWIGYLLDEDNEKDFRISMTTRIISEEYCGIKTLFVDSLYSPRLITNDIADEAYKGLEDFAKMNKCNVMSTENSNTRLENFLFSLGFKKCKSVYIKNLHL